MPHHRTHLITLKHKFTLAFAVLCALSCCSQSNHFTLACSSRTVPKARPLSSIPASGAPSTTTRRPYTISTTTTTTTPRPNITFPTYNCPETYEAWYCLNEGVCFLIKIGDSIMYNCECALGFMGPRCEYKELDGSLLPKRSQTKLEKASIASGATCALLFMLFICLTLYLRYDQRSKTTGLLNDTVEEDNNEGSCCRCCQDQQRCCDNAYFEAIDDDYRGKMYRYGDGSLLRQHMEAFPPLSFSFRRSAKL